MATDTFDKYEFQVADTVKSILERNVGKRAAVKLHSGDELSGIVTSVGNSTFQLSGLLGREFFDGFIAIDRISAVILRMREA